MRSVETSEMSGNDQPNGDWPDVLTDEQVGLPNDMAIKNQVA